MNNENKTTLVVMAAGMGSRFGGLKQIEPFGPNGEVIVDFSSYDAVEAGFSKIVFVIKKAIEKDFREVAGKRIEKITDVEYVFQEMDKIPEGFSIPEGRVKPWGTGHAILCARNAVSTPFAVVNADDYYGKMAYKVINDYLIQTGNMCMVGFKLGNTLTENGTVTRGVCETEAGFLTKVTETFELDKNSGIPLDTTVSMNMWGFNTDIFDVLEDKFKVFLNGEMKNPLKDEFLLPTIVDDMIRNQGAKVKVLRTDDRWYGVTYKEDVIPVREALGHLVEKGLYNNF